MRPPIEEVSPTIVFDAAFEGDQSVGSAFDQRRLSLHIPEKWDAPEWDAPLERTANGALSVRLGSSMGFCEASVPSRKDPDAQAASKWVRPIFFGQAATRCGLTLRKSVQ